jgi:hypothetical protein
MMKRRTILKGAAGVSVIAAGGTVWRAWDQGLIARPPAAAYEPWETWRSGASEGPLALVRAGILAASPHNTQPWRFRVTADSVELFADAGRHLGSMDPYRREMHIGLGCALENMVIAAGALGLRARVIVNDAELPAGGPGGEEPVAVLRLAPGLRSPSQLYQAIPNRHTNRGPYDTARPVSTNALESLRSVAATLGGPSLALFPDGPERTQLGRLTVEATERIADDPAMSHDGHRWYRHEREEIERHRDGPTLRAAGLSPAMTVVASLLPAPSAASAHAHWLRATREVHVPTASALGLFATPDPYRRAAAVQLGRAWQRVHLWATARGIAMQPLNQAPEVADRERQRGRDPKVGDRLRQIGRETGGVPTFVFRLGHPEQPAAASPRRDVASVTSGAVAATAGGRA